MNEHSDTPFRVDVAEAERLIAAAMPACATARVPLAAATGMTLAETVRAERDQPPFDRATMDGIAVAAAAVAAGSAGFRVAGIQAAGAPRSRLDDSAACMEIMTGAVLPEGADTVIPVERIRMDNGIARLEDNYSAEPGQFIHRRASDHKAGATLLQPGTGIGAAEMAILTASGQPDVAIAGWPEIAVISTGDELVDVGAPLADHQIRSSNDRAIEAALRLHGCDKTRRARLPDDEASLMTEIGELHDACDVLILSGGVSMGKYDYVPLVLQRLGVQLVFHKILQRPGLPMWFGCSAAGKPVFALPGNPVSTLVCLTRYVLPALLSAQGRVIPIEMLPLAEDVHFAPDLCWFLPVAIDHSSGSPRAVPKPTNTSGDFIGLRGTAGFVELPRGKEHFQAGESVRFWSWQS